MNIRSARSPIGTRSEFASTNIRITAPGTSWPTNQPATISQTAVELVPGKPYTLDFITADYDDTMADKVNPRYFDIGVTLKDAQIVHEFTYIDERTKGQADFITAKTNYRYYRFIPEKDTVELTFTGSAKAGEKLIMNYVKIAPYFEEK